MVNPMKSPRVVSWNRGTPKSSMFMGIFHSMNHPAMGVPLWKPPYLWGGKHHLPSENFGRSALGSVSSSWCTAGRPDGSRHGTQMTTKGGRFWRDLNGWYSWDIYRRYESAFFLIMTWVTNRWCMLNTNDIRCDLSLSWIWTDGIQMYPWVI